MFVHTPIIHCQLFCHVVVVVECGTLITKVCVLFFLFSVFFLLLLLFVLPSH